MLHCFDKGSLFDFVLHIDTCKFVSTPLLTLPAAFNSTMTHCHKLACCNITIFHHAVDFRAAGMGCSAGVIAVGLAQRLLAGEPNSRALVVSTENITLNWYSGNERSMLIPNTLFRMGGAGVLLTNRPSDRWTAKYSLQHIVRVHLGRDDSAYR